MRINPLRRLSVLNQFMLACGLILVAGALIIGWWINRRIEDDVAGNATRLTAVFVDATITPHLRQMNAFGELTPIARASLDQLVHTNIEGGDFVAFHVWGTDGLCLYTNLDVPAGLHHPHSQRFEAAVRGESSTQFSNRVDGAPQLGTSLDVLETYFPVRDAAGESVLAVVEFYQSMGMLRQSILLSQLQGWAVIGVATFLMFVVLYGIARRASDTIARQTGELAESRRQIQRAAVRAAQVNEAFMRRLGSDLHDGPAQDLGIALMRIEPLRHEMTAMVAAAPAAKSGEAAAYDLNLIHTALQSSIREIRHIASGLRLPDLKGLDLAGVIRKSVLDYTGKTSRTVEVSGPAAVPGHDALRPAVYRIVQEALNNGHIHGNPTTQRVRFQVTPDGALSLRIDDDGCGFDPARAAGSHNRMSLGLSGLQERAEILGGWLMVQSEPGKGTRVHAWLPLANLEDESTPAGAADADPAGGASPGGESL